VHKPEHLHAGTRVKILQPTYVAGRIGVILTQEELVGRQVTDRWIVQVEAEDVLLSLTPGEFHILQS